PPRVLAFLVRLPEREIAWILLERIRLLLLYLVQTLARQPPVIRKAIDAEVDVTARLVRVPVPNQVLDQRDDLGDRLRRLRLGIRPAEAERLGVLEVPLRRVRGELRALTRPGFVDPVVYVCDVLDERDLVAAELQPALEPQRDHVRPCIADVNALVHG